MEVEDQPAKLGAGPDRESRAVDVEDLRPGDGVVALDEEADRLGVLVLRQVGRRAEDRCPYPVPCAIRGRFGTRRP